MSKFVFGELTTAQRTTYVLASRVVIYDTDLDRYFCGDGSTTGGNPMSLKQLASAISTTNLPADGAIGGLTISATYSQSEVQALRDECEKLRDVLADLVGSYNDTVTS